MEPPPPTHRNEVLLAGVVTGPPAQRVLPSGDIVTSWRMRVDRAGEPGRFDVVACSAWTARLRRTVAPWQKGDHVEVSGALRRRFWRSGGAPASVYEVEVAQGRRTSPASRRPRKPG